MILVRLGKWSTVNDQYDVIKLILDSTQTAWYRITWLLYGMVLYNMIMYHMVLYCTVWYCTVYVSGNVVVVCCCITQCQYK